MIFKAMRLDLIKKEAKKCVENPFHYYNNYLSVADKKYKTGLTEEEFQELVRQIRKEDIKFKLSKTKKL
jgi:hypothetical protein